MATAQEVALEGWEDWLQLAYADIGGLAYHRRIWSRLGKIVELNDKVEGGRLFEVFASWYAHSQALGIRRQVDRSPDVKSLVRLLATLGDASDLITAKRLRDHYPDFAKQYAAQDFEEHLPAGWAERHVERLDRLAAPVRRFANKNVAHMADESATATYHDLDAALDGLVDALLSACFAVRCATPTRRSFLEAAEQFDWLKPLRVAWVTPEIEQALQDT